MIEQDSRALTLFSIQALDEKSPVSWKTTSTSTKTVTTNTIGSEFLGEGLSLVLGSFTYDSDVQPGLTGVDEEVGWVIQAGSSFEKKP